VKLHRLVLTNYRGIAHREIEFPDHGVVVVCGANEIGKSSMIEALDLLLESRDRSTKKEVKQVKPTNSDVGSEVSAEISCGPYRFVYRKRFHKKCGVDGADAAACSADRRRGPRTRPRDAGRDGGQRPVACPAGAAGHVDRRGGPVRL
jgi:recombinational DNA repair ATPase RecF